MISALLDLAIRLETGAIDPGFSHLEVEHQEISMHDIGSMYAKQLQAGVKAHLVIDLANLSPEQLHLFVKENF